MIENFKSKALKKFFWDGDGRKLNPAFLPKIRILLTVLDAADTIEDVQAAVPSCHALKGDRADDWSMTVSGNWRITFRFEDGDAHDVDFEDYHGD